MKQVTATLLLSLLTLGSALAAPPKKMDPTHNVGGYIDAGTTKPHTFTTYGPPRPLPVMSKADRNNTNNNLIRKKIDQYLEDFPATTAILLIDDGKILLEAYQGVGRPSSEFYSMSIGKSMTSLAVGKALCAGYIDSLDKKANILVPELGQSGFGRSTVRQLLMMSSGAYRSARSGQPAFKNGIGLHPEYGRPYKGYSWPMRLGQTSVDDLLWGRDWQQVLNKNVHSPGENFIYKGADTLALGKIVERVTGMPLARYFEQSVWRDVKPEAPGHWEADRNGSTMASSGFQARLRDWGRIGVWILDSLAQSDCFGQYLTRATQTQISTPKGSKSLFRGYGYQWWTEGKLAPGFWGLGYAGQMLAINPDTRKIMIKFAYRHDYGSAGTLMRLFKQWNAAP